ncbi:MAG: YlmC/YmxH family sporulation protein [Bacilli bacterium]|nr:YlmC/YmxH family sporulation protein [Bacilli bacterium]
MKLSELQSKSIITQDGRLMGRIIDVIIKENGNIESIIVEKSKFIISLFSNKNELEIKFNEILKIGDDVILVNIKE